MRKVLNDPTSNDHFIHQGYIHQQVLSEAEVDYALNELCKLCPETSFQPQGDRPSHSFIYGSYLQDDLTLRQTASNLVREVLTPHVENLLDRYRIVSCGFFIKAPRGGELGIHSHTQTTESFDITAVNFWCPLQETTVSNGTFHAVPGTHKIFPELITYGYKPFYAEYADLIKTQYSVALPSRAGQAVIFDDTMFHWSPNNLTDRPRYAIHCTCIPREARAIHMYFDKTGSRPVEVYEANDEFFVQNSFVRELPRPEDLKLIKYIPNLNRPYTRSEFEERMKNGDAIRSELYADLPATIPSTPVFKDPGLDHDFRVNGYIVVPLLGEAEIQKLLEIHERFTPEIPTDFYASTHEPDIEHRRAVNRAIGEVMDPLVLPMLAGYKSMLGSFICKRGTTTKGIIGIHHDYTFVDQDRCTGVHIWLPLTDVDAENGCLIVYPGSHSLVNHLSAVCGNPSPYDGVRKLLHEKCSLRFPMAAGTVLFLNERLLHASGENQTPAKRVVVGTAYIPEQETMRIYGVNPHNPEILDVFKVEDPSQLLLVGGKPLPYPYPDYLTPIGSVEYRPERLTPEQIRPLYNPIYENDETVAEKTQEQPAAVPVAAAPPPVAPPVAAKKSGLWGWLGRKER